MLTLRSSACTESQMRRSDDHELFSLTNRLSIWVVRQMSSFIHPSEVKERTL